MVCDCEARAIRKKQLEADRLAAGREKGRTAIHAELEKRGSEVLNTKFSSPHLV
jgi:hypothetical protein